MANYLKMTKRQQVIALLELGWTYRRIEAETGVRRETVSRYDRSAPVQMRPKCSPARTVRRAVADPAATDPDGSNPAKVFAGSASNAAKAFPGSALPPRSTAAPYRDAILEKLEQGLSLQRIWQDLVEEYGYGAQLRVGQALRPQPRADRAARWRATTGSGGRGPGRLLPGRADLRTDDGPVASALGLPHDAVPLAPRLRGGGLGPEARDLPAPARERLHRPGGRAEGRPPRQSQGRRGARLPLRSGRRTTIYAAFARHWGFTPLPTRPRNPEENGKQERSGGYVKDNALKGRRFESLEEQNALPAPLEPHDRAAPDPRHHAHAGLDALPGDRPAGAAPLAARAVRLLRERHAHGASPTATSRSRAPSTRCPLHLLGHDVRVRWDAHLVRLFHEETAGRRASPGRARSLCARGRVARIRSPPQPSVPPGRKLLGTLRARGPPLRRWAEAAFAERGVRAYRLIQGVLGLTRTHPKNACSTRPSAPSRIACSATGTSRAWPRVAPGPIPERACSRTSTTSIRP